MLGTVTAILGGATGIAGTLRQATDARAAERDAKLVPAHNAARLKAVGIGLAIGAAVGVMYRVITAE
jgi:hypothetical protein